MTTANMGVGDIPVIWDQALRMEIARRHAHLTQNDLAERLQIAPLSINRYERGLRQPKAAVVMAWAMATGVDLHWLQTGETPSPDGDGASRLVCAIRDLNPEPADLESDDDYWLVAA